MESSDFDIDNNHRVASPSVGGEFHEAVTEKDHSHGRSASTPPQSPKSFQHLSAKDGKNLLSSLALQRAGLGTVTEWIDGTTIQTADNGASKTSHASTGFAWGLYHHTLELFSLLLPTTSGWSTPNYSRDCEKAFKNSLGKLFLWGDGFRDSKLEAVLDESGGLRETVIETLVAISKILLFKLAPKCLETSPPPENQRVRQELHDLEILVEKARFITESDYESDASSVQSGAEASQDFSSGITNALRVYVGCLMELLPSMEETLSSLKFDDSEDEKPQPIDFQISGPAQPYVLKVYDKFPKADMHLMHRLGEANWQRHMTLRLRNEQIDDAEISQELPKTVFVAVSMFHDSGLGSSLPPESTYTATIASHSSFQSTAADRNSGDLRVPPTPKEVFEGIPFQCQICGNMLSRIKNRIDWR